jgi:phage I-like protein
MSKTTTQSIALSAQLIELGGAVPTEIKLLPAGKFKAKDGRPQGLSNWVMTDASATAILAAGTQQQDKYLIDYDHQTLHSKSNGQQAPAAGWFSALQWRAKDGLYATDVKWTAAATKAITEKEYRYISPVLTFNQKTGEVTGLLMAALVNYPALDGLNDLAAAHFNLYQSEKPMNKEQLEALCLQEGADDAAILSAITALRESALQVTALSAQVAALQTPDPSKFVPLSDMAALQSELAALSAIVQADTINKLIEPALADGRLLPTQKTWAESLGKSDMTALSTYLETAQPIAALKNTQTGGQAPDQRNKHQFKAAQGYTVDEEQATLHAQIEAHAKEKNIPYQAAALAIGAN